MVRKRSQRLDDRREFGVICELLGIQLYPKKTLAHRSEYFIFPSFILLEVLSIS
jgi:hypothetical protein